MGADAEWCGQCYALRSAAQPSAASQTTLPQFGSGTPRFGSTGPGTTASAAPASTLTPVRAVPVKRVAHATIKSRWRKTPTTFGPLGRILATIGLVVPEVLLVVVGILTGGFTLAGAAVWGGIIMPWGLKDTWRAGTMPDPSAAPAAPRNSLF